MPRDSLTDLHSFATAVEARSFTKAAARLGLTQSALSHAMTGLERRLGVQLLNRTTRGVAPTEAGERLFRILAPQFEGIEAELAALAGLHGKPVGTFRITSGEHAAATLLFPALRGLAAAHPDIKVEVVTENGLVDIVAGRFDAGVRMGEQVERDMVAVRIGPELRMAVVAAPGYFARRRRPRIPADLTDHICVNIHLVAYGGLYAWEFAKGGREMRVRVDGPLAFSSIGLVREAALAGVGLACMPEDLVLDDIAQGRLVRVLADWCPPFPGYYLYYPSRRQHSPAFAAVVEALRYRG